MYQTIVLGLGFLLLVGGGYLIKNVDSEGVVTTSLASPAEASSVLTLESLSGTYICDSSSGCENPRILDLSADGSVHMNTTYENGVEVLNEDGTWSIGINNRPVILLKGSTQETYPAPRMLSVRYASKTSLSGVTFDQKVYTDLKNPVFRKPDSQVE